jgi:hypothetical protein
MSSAIATQALPEIDGVCATAPAIVGSKKATTAAASPIGAQ